MNKILLCCAGGMSTSMLMQRMEKEAKEQGIAVEMQAVGFDEFADQIAAWDCCLLGPQIKYKLVEFQAIAAEKQKPVAVINTMDYGMMNGKKVLHDALALIQSHGE
ncbi:PTS system cellobiose-specific IIB component [Erwinia toletana]|uniref:PTS system cellobiose-specific IIB component n=1 Tax=Winslowiella toletana TaxID=92490 RepID=A0ABS4PCB1_9GAMM|nr:PTS sugar transporter subunit IIB [Winslowiella toletana]MBP2170274.1 PTS system cellobiose-specific IIB component [Winslowiella toletana]